MSRAYSTVLGTDQCPVSAIIIISLVVMELLWLLLEKGREMWNLSSQ